MSLKFRSGVWLNITTKTKKECWHTNIPRKIIAFRQNKPYNKINEGVFFVKLYLDNCSYNRPFDDQTQMKIHLETEAKLYIQECIREGQSVITL